MTNEAHSSRAAESTPASSATEGLLRDLVRKAFEAARESGRETWDQMTVAVLKNRLLDLTDRAFNEGDYGAQSITDLMRRLSDLVALDDDVRPPVVHFRGSTKAAAAPDGGSRVRRDLWNAVMDYRSQARYLWDGTRALREDVSEHSDWEHYQVLPTLTEVKMDDWRERFMAEEAGIIEAEDFRAMTEHWRRHRLGTNALPAALRQRWNAYLKRSVVAQLRAWFQASSIEVPENLLVLTRQTREEAAPPLKSVDAKELRELVLRCVQTMTVDELKALPLPAAAVLRARS